MNYKKKYDEALERAKSFKTPELRDVAEYIFPELKESEDEKIKHEIKVVLANTDLSQFALEYTFADMLAWLEKQDEQKSAWSREDDDDAWMNDIISKVENNLQLNKAEIDWLKSLKQRIGGKQ